MMIHRRQRLELAPDVLQSCNAEILDHMGFFSNDAPRCLSASEPIRRFLCRWLHGHTIKAEFLFDERRWRYWCDRCKCSLKGPE